MHDVTPDNPDRDALLAEVGPSVRGLATTGKGPVTAALLDRLPRLEIIACYSAGLDGIDTRAAAERGIAVTNTAAVLAEDVADIALALMLALSRGICAADRFVRDGHWRQGPFPLGRTLRDASVGIVGLGHIGSAVARRAGALGMRVAYTGPRRKPAAAHPFIASVREPAARSRFLVVSCAGGPETRHLIDADILKAIGPEGYLINVSRGSVVDQAAPVGALQAGTIAGAGLDVFENEPEVPAALTANPRVVLLPHIGSATTETRAAMGRAQVEALSRHLTKES